MLRVKDGASIRRTRGSQIPMHRARKVAAHREAQTGSFPVGLLADLHERVKDGVWLVGCDADPTACHGDGTRGDGRMNTRRGPSRGPFLFTVTALSRPALLQLSTKRVSPCPIEAPVGIEPTNSRFAVCRLTTWPRRRDHQARHQVNPAIPRSQARAARFAFGFERARARFPGSVT